MADNDTDETEAPAFAGGEVLEEPHGDDSPVTEEEETETVIEMADGLADDMGFKQEAGAEGNVTGGDFAEDAPGSTETPAPTSDTAEEEAGELEGKAAAEAAIEALEAAGVPTIDTDHEHAAYGSGYRAGGDDPGWLLTLAEMGRHLGSFFEPEEEGAFNALNAEELWSRWTLGYLDAAAGRMARPERPRKAEDMDF